ncbi:MAG: hypothetical protein IKV63_00975 [Clostridia bacterium]|nr:hypothetical protein [Clostridia bacterium]
MKKLIVISTVLALALSIFTYNSTPSLPQQIGETRDFVYRDSKEEIIKPGFVLQDDGVFTMTFSAVSSFFAVGKYEETENDLTFYTNEGDLWYHFIKTDKGYAYDTAKSTGSTWFADIPDGALFY